MEKQKYIVNYGKTDDNNWYAKCPECCPVTIVSQTEQEVKKNIVKVICVYMKDKKFKNISFQKSAEVIENPHKSVETYGLNG